MAIKYSTGTRPPGYGPGERVVIRIPYDAVPEEHADVRRKLAAGWKLGEVTGDDGSLFKYAGIYPPKPAA
jgi:hypothetical protein